MYVNCRGPDTSTTTFAAGWWVQSFSGNNRCPGFLRCRLSVSGRRRTWVSSGTCLWRPKASCRLRTTTTVPNTTSRRSLCCGGFRTRSKSKALRDRYYFICYDLVADGYRTCPYTALTYDHPYQKPYPSKQIQVGH